MKKDLSELKWIENLLPPAVQRKPMFGGFAYYLQERMVLALFEKTGDKNFKGQTFDYELWNGCFFPTERQYHPNILQKCAQLKVHPVLPKWLYLPLETENFEQEIELLLKEIRRNSQYFGIVPKSKAKQKLPNKKIKTITIDTRHPQMFRDEPLAQRLATAKNISDLKNLGPRSEQEFHGAGIKTVAQFVKMGWQKALVKLVKNNVRNRHSMFAYAIIGALQNKEWNAISEMEKQQAREFVASLKKKS